LTALSLEPTCVGARSPSSARAAATIVRQRDCYSNLALAVAKGSKQPAQELPADNAARLVVFDAMALAERESSGAEGLSDDALFERVIGRLRVFFPRELHVLGEREYLRAKVEACVDQGVLRRDPGNEGHVQLGDATPSIRYPDGTIREYTAGLEGARERLEADEAKLRRGSFDVRRLVRSAADDRKSDSFTGLVDSMHEHGFLDQFPVAVSSTGQVIDGLARVAAAAEANVPMKSHHRVEIPARRDTPLHHVLLVFDANADRLSDEDRARVRDTVENRTGRSWFDIEEDLALTREWRRVVPKKYTAVLDVDLVAFANQHEPKVQVTIDGTRVGLSSLTRQAGLPPWSRDNLEPYVAKEEARTEYSGGRKAWFVKIADAIVGIENMQRDRADRGLKLDSAWDDIRNWLIETFESKPPAEADQDVADPVSALNNDPVLPGFG
jgi:hypothetical protein